MRPIASPTSVQAAFVAALAFPVARTSRASRLGARTNPGQRCARPSEPALRPLLGSFHQFIEFCVETMTQRAFGAQIVDQCLRLGHDIVVHFALAEQLPPTRGHFFLGNQGNLTQTRNRIRHWSSFYSVRAASQAWFCWKNGRKTWRSRIALILTAELVEAARSVGVGTKVCITATRSSRR